MTGVHTRALDYMVLFFGRKGYKWWGEVSNAQVARVINSCFRSNFPTLPNHKPYRVPGGTVWFQSVLLITHFQQFLLVRIATPPQPTLQSTEKVDSIKIIKACCFPLPLAPFIITLMAFFFSVLTNALTNKCSQTSWGAQLVLGVRTQ